MQNETVRGNAPAAAQGAIAREVRLCLACLHENRGGEQSCEVCGTSLYLILCSACEAVNGPGALRCHGCGAALGNEAGDKPAVAPPASRTSVARTEASAKPAVAPPASQTSLARTEASGKPAAAPTARRTNRARLALSLAALVAVAALAYQYVPRTAHVTRSQEGRIVESAPVERSDPPARAELPSKPPVRAELPSKPPARTQAPSKAPARAQLPSTQGNAAASAVGSSASLGSASKASRAYPRVTHTRLDDSNSTPAAAAVAPAAPDASQKSEARCSEEVTALGLCNISAKREVSK
jgi:hypothetical protein